MSAPQGKAKGPLSHLRVLDLTIFLSGPFATQMLGDLGAEVIKVEAPDGDMTRRLPPHFVGRESCYYLSINRNKSSVALDLKTQAGRELLRRLALSCDIVVENFRPGVLDRLGLSYDDISREKPQIVWCSISGFGQDGPYRDRPAYDMIVQAMSGGMSLTGEPEGRSVRSGIPIGDLAAGMYAVSGMLAAVIESQRTGVGKWVDIAMLDCQVAMLAYQAAYYLASGEAPGRQGAGHDSIPTYRSFPCGDGRDVVITANTERMWRNLCRVLGLEHLAEDERFANNESRYRNRHELWSLLEAAFAKRSAAEWSALLIEAEIPAAEVASLDRTFADPQVLHRDMLLEMREGDDVLRVAGNPLKFRNAAEREHAFPPHLGADSADVLRNVLSLSDEDIEKLRRDGVISGDA
jgi:CoA:oxalate CoA-transferase